MPEVPQLELPQVREEGVPFVRNSPDAPIAAFGGGQTLDNLTTATKGAISDVGQIAQEEKQKADQVALMSADKQLSDLETNLQVQTSKMLGKDSAAAPDVVQKNWAKGVQDVTSGLSNQVQRMAVARFANARYESLNKNVQMHVSSQLSAYDDQETQSYIDTSRQAAVLNSFDDGRISQEISRQKAAIDDWAKRKGIPQNSDSYKEKLAEIESQTHKDVISQRLDFGTVASAKQYFDANKESMTSGDILAASKVIDERQTISQGMAAYDQVKNMKLSDGQPNETKMRAAVMAMDDLSDQKKEKVWDYVKARSNEDLMNKNRRDAANERSFMNNVVDARKQGQPLADALKLVDKFGTDDYDKTVKARAIQAVYAPPSESDIPTKVALWEGIQNGTATKSDIDAAQSNNKLNASDWSSLREEYYKATVEGRSPQMKYTNDRIKELATQTFGDKEKSAEFINMVNTNSINATPEQKFKNAQDLLQKDPTTQHSFFGIFNWGGKQKYQSAQQQHDANNLAFGKAQSDLGNETVKAIGQGVLQNKSDFTPADVDAFSVQLGGYDKIKPGTPANDAMQWLIKHNMPLVPANVQAVMQRHQLGNK